MAKTERTNAMSFEKKWRAAFFICGVFFVVIGLLTLETRVLEGVVVIIGGLAWVWIGVHG